jgi:hypothetical protein
MAEEDEAFADVTLEAQREILKSKIFPNVVRFGQ